MASADDTAQLLERTPMFAGLSSTELEELAKVAVPRTYEAGQVVFREGDEGDTCFVVRFGAVKITREHGGRTIALAELRAGDMFGELSMFGGEVRSATAQALEDTAAVALTPDGGDGSRADHRPRLRTRAPLPPALRRVFGLGFCLITRPLRLWECFLVTFPARQCALLRRALAFFSVSPTTRGTWQAAAGGDKRGAPGRTTSPPGPGASGVPADAMTTIV